MADTAREDFERRLLALVRSQLDYMDEDFPDGWEITDFVVTARYYSAPAPDRERSPWEGGPYPGWLANQWTRGSATAYFVDRELLDDSLAYINARVEEARRSPAEPDDQVDTDESE